MKYDFYNWGRLGVTFLGDDADGTSRSWSSKITGSREEWYSDKELGGCDCERIESQVDWCYQHEIGVGERIDGCVRFRRLLGGDLL